ncbi:MAG: RIP metalloprotease RseP [Desulfotignum sp.]|nr:RIP metalloprotease RseP [Desulfotignum sp.]MCF8125440.1 RIP metalloprotease RseP [Desulfotignum sp.]
MGHSVVAFVIVIGVLVFIHELGHFLAARFFKVGVDVFSLGFGPKIFKKMKGRTEYCISAVPLGGYVKMVGEEPGKALDPADKDLSFSHKPLYQKSLIVAAGPMFNFFLAIFIFYVLYQFSGIYLSKPVIGEVLDGTPAQHAGLLPGDVITVIDGKQIRSFEDISRIISNSDGQALDIGVNRDGRIIQISMIPEQQKTVNLFEETVDRYVIGIRGTGEVFHQPLNPFQAMGRSISDTFGLVKLTILSVGKMVSGSLSADNLGGPIMIAQMAGEQAKAGAVNFVWFIALLSVNLGIINLFPIPVLDGGHLVFFGIEAVTGKQVSDKLKEKMIQFGAALLVALMIFVFYNDILRIFNGG